MTSETDEQFIVRMEKWSEPGSDADRLFALARRGAAVQWRTIETAPKDGTLLLIREGGYITTACYRAAYVSKWVVPTSNGWLEVNWILPTHWSPLPPPPAGETNE